MSAITQKLESHSVIKPLLSSRGDSSEIQEDLLSEVVFERCIANTPPLDPHSCLRKIALATSITTSLSAGAAFIPVSLPLPAGSLFAAANFVGFFKLDMWAIRGTIHDLLGPRGEKEVVLLNRTAKGKCFTAAVMVASTAIALLSQVPVALPSLDYDGKLKIPAVICLFVGGALLPIRSLQLTIDKTIRARNASLGKTGKKLENLRMLMASMIDEHREMFRKMDRISKLEHIDCLQQAQGTDVERARKLIEQILEEPLETQEVQKRSLSSYFPTAAGVFIAGSLQTGLAIYTFEKTKEHIVDNDVAAGTLAGSVVLSGIYLSGLSILNTTERIAGAFLRCIKGQREKSMAEQFRPKLTQSLKLLGLLIDLGALGATTVIWGDFYKNNLPAKLYFDITLCLAYFLFLSTSTLDMVDEAVAEIVQRTGSHNERQIVQLNDQLSQIKKIIEQSSLLDFSEFLGKCSNELKVKLLDRVDLSIEMLESLKNCVH